MPAFRFVFKGKPIAKHRPRFARRGKFTVTYSDQQTEEGRFLWEIKQQWGQRPPIETAITLRAYFYFAYPKSMPKKMVESKPSYTKAPDLTNCIKFFEDVFNGTVWVDDSQVVGLSASKEYGDPRTEITIWWNEGKECHDKIHDK